MMTDNRIHRAQQTGAPVAFVENIEPILILPYNVGVLKGAPHPNAAYLFSAFLASPEAQVIWEKDRGQTSAFVPGTRASNFTKGKQLVFMGGQEQQYVERLSNEYSKILGFIR
jgi:ABC-type Fe3+ transport system substrate-binding protein